MLLLSCPVLPSAIGLDESPLKTGDSVVVVVSTVVVVVVVVVVVTIAAETINIQLYMRLLICMCDSCEIAAVYVLGIFRS